jgi:hypothetical protein
MTSQELSQALQKGEVKQVKPELPAQQSQAPVSAPSLSIDEFLIVLSALRMPKKHLTTAPTLTPKTLLDQIQFYDDGSNRRLYLYVNKVWRFVTLT